MKTGNVCTKHPELEGRRHNGGNCPYCVREKRGYGVATPKDIKNRNNAYRLANIEKIKAGQKLYRDKNPEKVRENNLKRTGFTIELFDKKLKEQNNLCAICAVDLTKLPQRHVHADHCHSTKTPRGILCHYCNSGLGLFKDNPQILRLAAIYAELHSAQG